MKLDRNHSGRAMLSISALMLVGCGAAVASGTAPAKLSAQASSPASSGSAPPAQPSQSAATESSSDAQQQTTPEWSSASGFDPKAWMKSHHVSGQLPADVNCEAAQVRTPVLDAISCDARLEIQVARPIVQASADEPPTVIPPTVQFRRMIYVAAGGALRRVFDIPIEAGPLNPVTKDPDANAFARLVVELDSTGERLSVMDDAEFSCERARAKQKELAADKDTAETASWLKAAVDPVCAARGDYSWKNGAFHKLPGKKMK